MTYLPLKLCVGDQTALPIIFQVSPDAVRDAAVFFQSRITSFEVLTHHFSAFVKEVSNVHSWNVAI
jgi:hypothetical protein